MTGKKALNILAIVVLIGSAAYAHAADIPQVTLSIGGKAAQGGGLSINLQVLLILTLLTFAPAILILLTSFTRILVVLSLLRQALGTQQLPSNQILIGLALFLTFFIMTPVWQNVNSQALQPYLNHKINEKTALDRAVAPIKKFMLHQTREKDLALFVNFSKNKEAQHFSTVPMTCVIPAFVISELKTAFQIGFLLYIPFLILDVVVASILLSMGMMMLPPIMISLPFKLLLFVMVDGWYLIVGSLVKSFM